MAFKKMDTNKPVFILAQGPSIKQLEEWIDRFKDLDVYWASFNRFDLVEDILAKAGLHLNILFMSNGKRYLEIKEKTRTFLNSGGDRIVIISCDKHTKNLMCFEPEDADLKEMVDNSNVNVYRCYHSLDNGSGMHSIAGIQSIGFRRMCLFGFDGATTIEDPMLYHYQQEKYVNEILEDVCCIVSDTKKINRLGWNVFIENHTSNPYFTAKDVDIKNCSEYSKIELFPIINYCDVEKIYGASEKMNGAKK